MAQCSQWQCEYAVKEVICNTFEMLKMNEYVQEHMTHTSVTSFQWKDECIAHIVWVVNDKVLHLGSVLLVQLKKGITL